MDTIKTIAGKFFTIKNKVNDRVKAILLWAIFISVWYMDAEQVCNAGLTGEMLRPQIPDHGFLFYLAQN